MSISVNDIEKIASLAKLRLKEGDKQRLFVDLNKILDYMEIIDELDTGEVPEMSHPSEGKTLLRDDKVQAGLDREKALKNTHHVRDGLIGVPKVVKSK